MTSKEFLQSNKQLLIGAVGTKINRLEQKVRWTEKNDPEFKGAQSRKNKIKELAILMEWLENGTFED
jgi:hypothetical protein